MKQRQISTLKQRRISTLKQHQISTLKQRHISTLKNVIFQRWFVLTKSNVFSTLKFEVVSTLFQLIFACWLVTCGADLCEQAGKQYLVVMDYFLRYIEIVHLESVTGYYTIGKVKICLRFGASQKCLLVIIEVRFASELFKNFALQYRFRHIYTCPHFPLPNGEVESAVKIAKRILRQPDLFLALMAYRSTPVTATGMSPSEPIMGRKLRTTVQISSEKLKPEFNPIQSITN